MTRLNAGWVWEIIFNGDSLLEPGGFRILFIRRLLDIDGMTDEQVIFWQMHILADQDHGDEGIEMVSNYAITGEQRKAVFDCTIPIDIWLISASRTAMFLCFASTSAFIIESAS